MNELKSYDISDTKPLEKMNRLIEEKYQLLKTLEGKEKKFNCLKILSDFCAKLIEIYSNNNESYNIYSRLIENYRRILKLYSEMIIINNDNKIDDNLINKIKEIFALSFNFYNQNMICIFSQIKEKNDLNYFHIILFYAYLLYNEGQKLLEKGKDYIKSYIKDYLNSFIKNTSARMKSPCDTINDNINRQELIEYLEKKYMENPINFINFIKILKIHELNWIEEKDRLLSTGLKYSGCFQNILQKKIEQQELNNEAYLYVETFCLLSIIKIKFFAKKNQSLYDIKFYENLISKIDYNIEKVDIDENEFSNWSINYEEMKKEIETKKEALLLIEKEKIKIKNKSIIEELNNLYKNKMSEKKPKEFIEFILQNYPYHGYDYDASKTSSCYMNVEYLISKYHPGNYFFGPYAIEDEPIYAIYIEIFKILLKMKDDSDKIK